MSDSIAQNDPSVPKTKRNNRILELYKKGYRALAIRDILREEGFPKEDVVSPQRVYQIVQEHLSKGKNDK